jgi:hypothetical protein
MIEAYIELTLTAFVNVNNTRWDEIGDILAGVLAYLFTIILIA